MLIDVFVNGDWDTSFDTHQEVRIWDKGTVYQMDSSLFEKFIDDLEEKGYDCYLCPQLFMHPDWNGVFNYITK